jgi:hypothetical protein
MHALSGFHWSTGQNPLGIPSVDMFCVRNALCHMKGWMPGSDEWNSIPPGPPGTDLKRLVIERPELGLQFHGLGDPDVPGHVRGIVTGKLASPYGPVDHAIYADKISEVVHEFLPSTISGVITDRLS